jgi:ATP-dependent Clp protease protease subunit
MTSPAPRPPRLPNWVDPDPRPEPDPAPRRLPSWPTSTADAPDVDVADRLLRERIVVAIGPLDAALAELTGTRLLLASRRGTDPVTLHLSAAEADLEAALSLAAVVDLLPAPVHALALGTVADAALAVFCAAQRRRAHPDALFVLRAPRWSKSPPGPGTAAPDVHRTAVRRKEQAGQLAIRIARACDRPADAVTADLETGLLLTAAQALDYGLVTELAQPPTGS